MFNNVGQLTYLINDKLHLKYFTFYKIIIIIIIIIIINTCFVLFYLLFYNIYS